MDSHNDSRQISRLEIVETGRRRRWSDEAKVRIVEESFSGPRLASATARRHGISNQLLFSWRQAYRAGRLGAPGGFVSAAIIPDRPEKLAGPDCRRIVIDCDIAVETLLRIIRGLETLP